MCWIFTNDLSKNWILKFIFFFSKYGSPSHRKCSTQMSTLTQTIHSWFIQNWSDFFSDGANKINQIWAKIHHSKWGVCGWHTFPRKNEQKKHKKWRKCKKSADQSVKWAIFLNKTCNLSHIWIISCNNFFFSFSNFACKIKCFLQINKLNTSCRCFALYFILSSSAIDSFLVVKWKTELNWMSYSKQNIWMKYCCR